MILSNTYQIFNRARGMKHNTEAELMQLCARNKDGSYSTQAARRDVLSQAARDLKAAGFYQLPATGLKPKHVQTLTEKWKAEGLSDATQKNRMAHLRWWAQKVGKQNVIPRTNSELGIGRRSYVTKESKAVTVSGEKLETIKDERLRTSLELQKAFGLRREECLKFQPAHAQSGGPDKIILQDSWCKGGRPREVPVTNDYQREVLARALALVGNGSMIPPDKKYVEQLKKYENTTNRAGLSKLHGLRHEYAQQRYRDLTGWESPASGGPTAKELTDDQRVWDFEVRLQISQELGHNRESITAVYLGR